MIVSGGAVERMGEGGAAGLRMKLEVCLGMMRRREGRTEFGVEFA